MVLAGIKVPDTVLVRDAIDLSRSASEPFSSTMRCAPGYSAYCFQKALNVVRMPSCWQTKDCATPRRSGDWVWVFEKIDLDSGRQSNIELILKVTRR